MTRKPFIWPLKVGMGLQRGGAPLQSLKLNKNCQKGYVTRTRRNLRLQCLGGVALGTYNLFQQCVKVFGNVKFQISKLKKWTKFQENQAYYDFNQFLYIVSSKTIFFHTVLFCCIHPINHYFLTISGYWFFLWMNISQGLKNLKCSIWSSVFNIYINA